MALSKLSNRERLQRLLKMQLNPEHVQNANSLLNNGVSMMRDIVNSSENDSNENALVSLADVRRAWMVNESGYKHHPAFKRRDPPDFTEFPAELLGGSNSTKPKQKEMANKLWEKGKAKLFHHLTGGLVDTDALDEIYCDCDGNCRVQRAKLSTLEWNVKFHEAGIIKPIPFVPCVSKITEQLPLYEPQTIHFVSFQKFQIEPHLCMISILTTTMFLSLLRRKRRSAW